MKKIIKWHSQHLEIDTIKGKLVEEDQMSDLYEDDGDEEEQHVRLYQTPFGTVDISDKYNPLKQFKLWVGHTNFTIGKRVCSTIKGLPGVEIFKPFTRYRFYLGVGECFEFTNVRLSVERAVCDFEDQQLFQIKDVEVRENVRTLISQISTNKKWAVYAFPNGKINYITQDTANFDESLRLYKESEALSHGLLFTHATWTKT